MYVDLFIWDVEDDPDGNYQNIVGAGDATADEVEGVICDHQGAPDSSEPSNFD
jgi:hypothetical protein